MPFFNELNKRPITELFEKFPQAHKYLALSLNGTNIAQSSPRSEDLTGLPKALLMYIKERMKINSGENFNYKK